MLSTKPVSLPVVSEPIRTGNDISHSHPLLNHVSLVRTPVQEKINRTKRQSCESAAGSLKIHRVPLPGPPSVKSRDVQGPQKLVVFAHRLLTFLCSVNYFSIMYNA